MATIQQVQVSDRVVAVGYKGFKGLNPHTALYAIKVGKEERFSMTHIQAKVVEGEVTAVSDPDLRMQYYARLANGKKACENGVIMFFLASEIDGGWFIGSVDCVVSGYVAVLKEGSVRNLTDWAEPKHLNLIRVGVVSCHSVPRLVEKVYKKVIG